MRLGAPKCGTLVVPGSDADRASLAHCALRLRSGEAVPKVMKSSRYLGVELNADVSIRRRRRR
jgi:hypothetical protein